MDEEMEMAPDVFAASGVGVLVILMSMDIVAFSTDFVTKEGL